MAILRLQIVNDTYMLKQEVDSSYEPINNKIIQSN
jgi:hypothetical protein